MKRRLYYITPFIIIPLLMLMCECLDNAGIIRMSPYILIVTLAFISFVFGNLSPTDKRFDYIMTVIIPLAFFCFMFIIGFLDKDDMETRFHLDKAFKVSLQLFALYSYCLMALITFLASFKPIRIMRIIKKNRG